MSYVLPNDQWREILTELVAAGQFLDGLFYRLYKNDVAPGPIQDVTIYEEADFDGYAPAGPVAWESPVTSVAGNARVFGGTAGFYASGSSTANNIYGFYVTVGSAGSTVRYGFRFDSPIAINGPGDFVVILPQWSLPEQEDQVVIGA